MPPPLVVGVGNEWRSDDGVGLVVARRLRERCPANVTIVECNGDIATLISAWSNYSRVIIIDAMISKAPAGTLRRLSAHESLALDKDALHSTHALGISDAIALSAELSTLPRELVIYAIEVGNVEYGNALSADVEKSAAALVEQIAIEVESSEQQP